MSEITRIELPYIQLQQLDFLLGDGTGVETIYPADADAIHFKAFVSGSRETCDRFVRVDYFADIPRYGVESFRSLFTYSPESKCFRSWAFSTASSEPAVFSGGFENGSLVMVSDPCQTPWGLQRLRQSFTPLASGGYFYLTERWTLEGWAKYCSVTFLPPS